MELPISYKHLHYRILGLVTALTIIIAGCALSSQSDVVIVITATFPPPQSQGQETPTLFSFQPPVQATPIPSDVPSAIQPQAAPTVIREYVVQPGDTLLGIAVQYGVALDVILRENQLDNPDLLEVGQVIRLPSVPEVTGSDFRILPDNRLVRAPGSSGFDVVSFVSGYPGFIRDATDEVDGDTLPATQIVERVALEYSVDPRLLLALLEYKGRWLSQRSLSQAEIDYPLGAPASSTGFDRKGLYRQLTWAADNLNRGYYGWQQDMIRWVQTSDEVRVVLPMTLNPATVGVQYLFSLTADVNTWRRQVAANGFIAVYTGLFGSPFSDAREPVVPANLTQPTLSLPFAQGETWFYTGGPHGGWGTGSAWSAVDFAPPDDLTIKTTACYVSDFFVTAAADGVIARSGDGSVVLDLDGDGDEATGWTLLYLHMATRDRIAAGSVVETGDRIGRPSCEGGFSNGTHAHIARRYNGEWIPASCENCRPEYTRPAFIMGGWQFVGLPRQEYQGYMIAGNESRVAEQGRNIADNEISW